MNKNKYVLTLALASVGLSVCAQQDTTQYLMSVVVTGTRTPKLLKDVPVQTKVITASDIEKADATNVEDLLQQEMPGVEFSYAMNQQKHLNVSGFGGQNVLFLVDGERLAGETMDDVDFSRLDMNNVARIEMVKGAASALYGSNAAGGVINIITRDSFKPWNLRLNARRAGHGEWRAGGVWSTKGKWLRNSLSAQYTTIDSYGLRNAPNPEAQVASTVFGSDVVNVKDQLTWTPLDGMKLVARAGYYYQQLNRTYDAPERYRDFSAGLKGVWKWSETDNAELSYSFDQYDKSDFYRRSGKDVRDYSNVQNTVRALYNHSWDEIGVLTLGADMSNDYLMNTNLSVGSKEQQSVDVFAQYDWILSPRWEMVGALRYDYFSENSENCLTPKFNVRYRLTDDVNIRFSYGMGFRAPTLKERYYDFDMAGIWIVKGNQQLKSERSHNFHLSGEYAKGNYNVTVSGYYNRVNDKLATGVPHYLPGDTKQLYLDYVNLDGYSVYGAEVSLQAQWNNGLSARASYAYTNEELPRDAEGNNVNNQYIPARKHSLSARVDWEHRFKGDCRLRLSLNGRAFSSVENMEFVDYYDVSKGTRNVKYPSYTMWKLSATQWITRGIRVNAAVDNIFNYKPKHYYYNSPLTTGANLMVGVAVDLD